MVPIEKVVENVVNYPTMQFLPKLMTGSQENAKKKQRFFEKLLVKKIKSFPGKTGIVTFLHL